jgi:uncharacterized protein (DUF1015 family)
VASRPYDVLSSAEAREEASGNPCSFYRISKAEVDLPEETDVHDAAVYDKARENLQAFIRESVLFREEKPCYYIYSLKMGDHTQTGLVAVSSVGDYENGVIKKHEFTRPEKELDRIRHISTTGAQSGNVFLAYHAVDELDSLIGEQQSRPPVYDFTTSDGVTHRVWVVSDEAVISRITTLFAERVACTYIADGHHRAASAARVALENGAGGEESSFFLTTLFPDNQLSILDYNRVVKDLNGLSEQDFLDKLSEDFAVTRTGDEEVKPSGPHAFGMYLNGSWYRLQAKEGTFTTDPIGILDVSILQNNVLDKLLGIKDPRTDKRIDFVGGIRGMKELARRVDSGEMKAAFAVFPVTMAQLFAIADTGRVMPPKSTWFEPKLRDGLLTHLIREEA